MIIGLRSSTDCRTIMIARLQGRVWKSEKVRKGGLVLMKKIHFLLAVMLLIAFSTPAMAQIQPGAFSLSPFLGGFLVRWRRGSEAQACLRLASRCRSHEKLGRRVASSTMYGPSMNPRTRIPTSTTIGSRDYTISCRRARLVPFLAVGLGGMSIDYSGNKGSRKPVRRGLRCGCEVLHPGLAGPSG